MPFELAAGTSTVDANPTLFDEFAAFLQSKQQEIIDQIEEIDGSGARFSNDPWGRFVEGGVGGSTSGGITRVIQGGDVVEKGACSFTLIENGVLSAERAAAIRSRQSVDVSSGDTYSAAALSIVFHSRSPMVPTFRSDVRIFFVTRKDKDGKPQTSMAWFGGGADLTPYYLFKEDIRFFHQIYQSLCEDHQGMGEEFSYQAMKKSCDEYFYLPARSEHRGTGGIFFDDLEASQESFAFVKSVTDRWMPSWLPIIEKRRKLSYSDQQRQWQLLRRGRYLEFNLLYDRGVKFGLANANPRVEGVMVSAPPLIAWEYNHQIEEGSAEAELTEILKNPIEWV